MRPVYIQREENGLHLLMERAASRYQKRKSCHWLSLNKFSMALNKLCIYMHVLCVLVYTKHDWAELYTIHRYLRCRYEKIRHLCYPHELIIQWKRQFIIQKKKKSNKYKVCIIIEDKIENLHLKSWSRKTFREIQYMRSNLFKVIKSSIFATWWVEVYWVYSQHNLRKKWENWSGLDYLA